MRVGRVVVMSAAEWAHFDPHAEFSLAPPWPGSSPRKLTTFATDGAGVSRLLSLRGDARAALDLVWAWPEGVAAARGKVVKLLTWELPPEQPPLLGTFENVVDVLLPALARSGANVAAPPWSTARARNVAFAALLREDPLREAMLRALRRGGALDPALAGGSVDDFFASVAAGASPEVLAQQARCLLCRRMLLMGPSNLGTGAAAVLEGAEGPGLAEYYVESRVPRDAEYELVPFEWQD